MRDVVVVGAGPCGLVALKELREAGHNATLFEASGDLGGVFASPVADYDLHLTISNWFMSFSDFPDPSRLHYPSGKAYLEYLHAYARHYHLEEHIKYNSRVSRAALRDDNRWSLEICQSGDRVLKIETDTLIVATGANQVPNVRVPGLEGFSGKIIHSSQYDAAFKAQVAEQKLRVLVVGAGESATDIASELAEESPNVMVWARRTPLFGPRYLDESMLEMERVNLNKKQKVPTNIFLESFTTNRMSTGSNVFLYGFFRWVLWHLPGTNVPYTQFALKHTAPAWIRADQATYVTKNFRICEAVSQNKLQVLVRPTVSTQGKTCRFSQAESEEGSAVEKDFDAIVLCTGYSNEFPWLQIPEELNFKANPRTWLYHSVPQMLANRLFFVGYARPQQGGIPPAAEMLSRYIARLLSGEVAPLPVDYSEQTRRDMESEKQYYCLSPHLNSLVDYSAYMESIARRLGCEPRLPAICVALFNLHMLSVLLLPLGYWYTSQVTMVSAALLWAVTSLGFFTIDDGILIKWWFYPQWGVWYRLRGPGARPESARDMLARAPLRDCIVTPATVVFFIYSVLVFYIQRILSVFLFVPYTTLRMFGWDWLSDKLDWLRPKLFVLHSCPWKFSDLFLP